VDRDLDAARIIKPDFEKQLARVGAKFAYVFDVNRKGGRTWDNDGRVEDIATGSAAGPQDLILLRMDWRVPRRQSKFRKAVLSDVQAFYSWSRKQTIKGGSVLRLRAMLLFSQAVNSTFEAGVEGFIRCLSKVTR
jgi:hypothetical protein